MIDQRHDETPVESPAESEAYLARLRAACEKVIRTLGQTPRYEHGEIGFILRIPACTSHYIFFGLSTIPTLDPDIFGFQLNVRIGGASYVAYDSYAQRTIQLLVTLNVWHTDPNDEQHIQELIDACYDLVLLRIDPADMNNNAVSRVD